MTGKGRAGWRGWLFPAVTIAAVMLAWQSVAAALASRLPPEVAIRIAPRSASVDASIAEQALSRGDLALAQEFAERSLLRAPFSVRPLRVLGLVHARQNLIPAANEMITLAGNWSLRDDPAHAWLVERRLRDGKYTSAFAHADTLVRRRTDIAPQVFNLFSAVAISDSRAVPALRDLLALRPPWRTAFLNDLKTRKDADTLELSLALSLAGSAEPLDRAERQVMYQRWLEETRFGAVKFARDRLDPAEALGLMNGRFAPDTASPIPFAWDIPTTSGLSAEITTDPVDERNNALRFSNSGLSPATVASQLMTLSPGRYRLTGRTLSEAPDMGTPWSLRLLCAGGAGLAEQTIAAGDAQWKQFAFSFEVPAACPAQWLRLDAGGSEGQSSSANWVDDLAIARQG